MSELRTNLLSNAAGTGPAGLFKQSAAKAWANLNGSTFGLRDSFGVSSAVDNGTGDYTFNYISSFTDINYAGGVSSSGFMSSTTTQLVGSSRFFAWSSSFTANDVASLIAQIHGDLA
jgi:hypothetical protein